MSGPERPRLRTISLDDEAAPGAAASSPALDLSDLSPRHRRARPLLEGDKRALVDVVARVLVLLGVSTLVAVVIGPRVAGADLPGKDDLGKPARAHVRSDRDYALVDRAATDARRLDARRQSRSVWDLDLARAHADSRVLDAALTKLARALEEAKDDGRPEQPSPAEHLESVRAQLAGDLALIGAEAPHDDDWHVLTHAQRRFPTLHDEITAAVRDALSSPIVGDRVLLALDEPRGVVVRTVPAELGRGERVIEHTAEVRDVENARAAFAAELTERLSSSAPDVERAELSRIARFAAGMLRTTLTYNATESEQRRRSAEERAPPELVRVHRGEMVLRPGQIIEGRHLVVLAAMERQQGERMRTRAALGTGAFVLLLCLVVYRFGLRGVFRRRVATRDLVYLGGLLLLGLVGLFLADRTVAPVVERWHVLPALALLCAVPTAFAAIQARLCLSADVALLLALLLALLGGVMTEAGATWTVVALVSSMAGAAVAGRAERKRTVLFAGLAAGIVGSAAAVTLEAFKSALDVAQLLWVGGACLASGAVAGGLAVATTPVFEGVFGYVTRLRLHALCDLNQPLLKDLIVHAPGTWHHSMRVAHLAVEGARAIGANAALARAMALYHDVGKIEKPLYFAENLQGRDNPHDKLDAGASALILREHVKHGVELARRHHIPRVVADVIAQHHGDNRMDFFLSRARTALLVEGRALTAADEDELDASFRYGGELPRSREAALVMLADQIEAATRALDEPNAEALAHVVDHFIDRALIEDALVESDVGLRDLDRVRAVFSSALLELFPRAAPRPAAP